jgi:glycosyltransferase involved in cell wall biosynthesis
MHGTPSISLVTCSFQQARFLDATVRSVLAQCYPGLEYIVIDGGSTDGSKAIIERHAASLAYWVSEPDGGQTDALIKGFDRATGEICGWLCSDDILLPGALSRVGDFFRTHADINAVYGDSLWIDIDGQPIRPKREMGFNRFVFLHYGNYVPQPSMFWRRSLYETVGGLHPGFDVAMDNDLWEKFSARDRIFHIPFYLSCMRQYPQQKTTASWLRPRGRSEGTMVRTRASAIARVPGLHPPLRWLAHMIRVAQKSACGGYTAVIPEEFRPWLEAHATHAY